MKLITSFIPALFIGLAFTSCSKGAFGIKGKGSNVTQIRDVSGFNELELSISADVYYVQDTEYSVEISAQQNVLSYLKTKVKENQLEIEFDRNVFSHSKIKIIIHAPEIRNFEINGSGRIIAEGSVSTGNLKLDIHGSGNINFASVTAPVFEAEIEGSGKISVGGGSTDNSSLEISGSGDIEVQDMIAKQASAEIEGSGNITLRATDNLNAAISGSGKIRYYGNPSVNVSISGSGKVIHM